MKEVKAIISQKKRNNKRFAEMTMINNEHKKTIMSATRRFLRYSLPER